MRDHRTFQPATLAHCMSQFLISLLSVSLCLYSTGFIFLENLSIYLVYNYLNYLNSNSPVSFLVAITLELFYLLQYKCLFFLSKYTVFLFTYTLSLLILLLWGLFIMYYLSNFYFLSNFHFTALGEILTSFLD